jgi:hypothetical protein
LLPERQAFPHVHAASRKKDGFFNSQLERRIFQFTTCMRQAARKTGFPIHNAHAAAARKTGFSIHNAHAAEPQERRIFQFTTRMR